MIATGHAGFCWNNQKCGQYRRVCSWDRRFRKAQRQALADEHHEDQSEMGYGIGLGPEVLVQIVIVEGP